MGKVSRARDGSAFETWAPGEDAGRFLARLNEDWIKSARRMSPRLLTDLLEFMAGPLSEYFAALDPLALGDRVSWAGPSPAPVWLDTAREYMERWIHQQHIRDATVRAGQTEPQFVHPVLAASMHALPPAMEKHGSSPGALVVAIGGPAGGSWSVVHADQRWQLFEGTADDPRASVRVAAEDWWRLVTLGLRPEDVRLRAAVEGDDALVRAALSAIAIIA